MVQYTLITDSLEYDQIHTQKIFEKICLVEDWSLESSKYFVPHSIRGSYLIKLSGPCPNLTDPFLCFMNKLYLKR